MVRLFMASDGISDDDMRRVHSSVDPRPDGEAGMIVGPEVPEIPDPEETPDAQGGCGRSDTPGQC